MVVMDDLMKWKQRKKMEERQNSACQGRGDDKYDFKDFPLHPMPSEPGAYLTTPKLLHRNIDDEWDA